MTLIRADGPYYTAILPLNHSIDECFDNPERAQIGCGKCRQIAAIQPGPEDWVYCQLCGCCGLDEDDEGHIECFGGCNLADGKHGPIGDGTADRERFGAVGAAGSGQGVRDEGTAEVLAGGLRGRVYRGAGEPVIVEQLQGRQAGAAV